VSGAVIDSVLFNDWHPVCRSASVRASAGIRTQLLGQRIVVVRDATTGDAVAHARREPVQSVRMFATCERYDLVWVCLGTPASQPPTFPESGLPGFVSACCGPFPNVRASGTRLIENYIDAAHFPFVHGGVLGDPAMPEIGDYDARVTANGVESDPIRVFQPDPFAGTPGEVTYTYHVFRPLTAHFTKHMPTARNGMVLTITPHEERHSTAWFIVATNGRPGLDADALEREYTPRITSIFGQDRAIVESQRPELLPLDLQSELHLKSDRVAIAYRRWLRDLGVTWGVA
jgi:phenylpropionate dioxygenase-like ring-hydroxylating dioxygenase large terminal subunit